MVAVCRTVTVTQFYWSTATLTRLLIVYDSVDRNGAVSDQKILKFFVPHGSIQAGHVGVWSLLKVRERNYKRPWWGQVEARSRGSIFLFPGADGEGRTW
jgi:hypothetical protein